MRGRRCTGCSEGNTGRKGAVRSCERYCVAIKKKMLILAKTSSPCSVKKSFWGSTGFYIAYKPDWTWIKLRGARQFSRWRARWDEMTVFSVACWHYKGHIGKLISSRRRKNLRSDVGGCRPGTLLVLRGVHRFTPDSYLPLRKKPLASASTCLQDWLAWVFFTMAPPRLCLEY